MAAKLGPIGLAVTGVEHAYDVWNWPAQQTQNLVYSVIVQPAQNFIHADGIDQPLSSGMTVTAEIRTGKRRILEYIFSPLVEIAATAMIER